MMNRIPASVLADRLRPALVGLVQKYAVPGPPGWTLHTGSEDAAGPHAMLPGWTALNGPLDAGCVPLLPWRSQRRFIELKRLVDDQVVTPVCMARFACQTDGSSLDLAAILYREFDLAEWLLGSPIAAVTASITGPVANVIVRLANGVVCGVEAGATLPAGTAMIDRHELIAQRGVACDRVVDTQVPQNSVYAFTAAGHQPVHRHRRRAVRAGARRGAPGPRGLRHVAPSRSGPRPCGNSTAGSPRWCVWPLSQTGVANGLPWKESCR